MIALGIDAGASSTRWLLLDEGESELGRGRTGPITGHVFTTDERQENLARLRQLLDEALALARPDGVVAGITGLHAGTEAAEVLRRCVLETIGAPAPRVLVTNDMDVAYAAAFAPGEGVLLYAGTGSVAYHVADDGSVVRAGGYGYLIDDAGAGYWIGHEGLKQVMRRADEAGQPASLPLDRAVYAALGSERWEELVAIVYGGGRSTVAALAPAVARAADDGDEAALRILDEAGRELARLAHVVQRRAGGKLPVAFAGGIASMHPRLGEALRGALPAGTELRLVTVEPVHAAARLALARGRADPA